MPGSAEKKMIQFIVKYRHDVKYGRYLTNVHGRVKPYRCWLQIGISIYSTVDNRPLEIRPLPLGVYEFSKVFFFVSKIGS